jgi:hypothetical protein
MQNRLCSGVVEPGVGLDQLASCPEGHSKLGAMRSVQHHHVQRTPPGPPGQPPDEREPDERPPIEEPPEPIPIPPEKPPEPPMRAAPERHRSCPY